MIDNNDAKAPHADSVEQGGCFSKGRLRDEFGLKPKPGAEPVAFYKNDFGRKFGVYRTADCVPIKSRRTKAPSEKQLRASALLALKAKLNSKSGKAAGRAARWLSEKPLFLDSETTGLDDKAQIVEIAISDSEGVVLFETRLRPTVPVEPDAQRIHGIDPESLSNAPSWPDVSGQVKDILCGRTLIVFNSSFDIRLIRQTAAAFDEPADWVSELKTHCAMHLAADVFGPTNRYGTISLSKAVECSGVEWRGMAHGAVADTLTTVELVKSIANTWHDLYAKVNALEGST